MIGRMKLGYLVLGVRRLDAWNAFATAMLGLSPAGSNSDGSVGYRMDEAAQRLIVAPNGADDIAALGLELEDERAFADMAARLDRAGVPASEDRDAARARRVERLLAFSDPAGTRVEAVLGMAAARGAFASEHFPAGFRSDDTGFGHVVLAARSIEPLERFYTGVLGFGVTERLATRVGPIDLKGTFLHCNRRHHTLALLQMPQRKRLNHFMLQAESMVDVLRAYDRARSQKLPLSLDLGQHPTPDSTVSFYGRTPSGFDFEIGAGCQEIEPAGWQAPSQTSTSAWGHKPTLGLQLRAAKELIAARLGA